MCQLSLGINEQLVARLVSRPKMKWQWILRMAAKNWIDEHTSDRAARIKQKAEYA